MDDGLAAKSASFLVPAMVAWKVDWLVEAMAFSTDVQMAAN